MKLIKPKQVEEPKSESLIELKAQAYDAAAQVQAWQKTLSDLTTKINNFGSNSINIR